MTVKKIQTSKVNLLLVSICLAFGFLPTASAIERFKVGLLDKSPWSYLDSRGQVAGIYPDLLRYVAKRSNGQLQFSFRVYPLARLIREIKIPNRVDFTLLSHTTKRSEYVEPQIALFRTPFVVYSRKESPVKSAADLQGKLVTALIGGSGCPCTEPAIEYTRVRLQRHSQALRMLKKGRVDAVSGPAIRMELLIAKFEMADMLAPPYIYEWRDIWFLSSKYLGQSNSLPILRNIMRSPEFFAYHQQLLAAALTPEQQKHVELIDPAAQAPIPQSYNTETDSTEMKSNSQLK